MVTDINGGINCKDDVEGLMVCEVSEMVSDDIVTATNTPNYHQSVQPDL